VVPHPRARIDAFALVCNHIPVPVGDIMGEKYMTKERRARGGEGKGEDLDGADGTYLDQPR
jgi:hypothetical protein